MPVGEWTRLAYLRWKSSIPQTGIPGHKATRKAAWVCTAPWFLMVGELWSAAFSSCVVVSTLLWRSLFLNWATINTSLCRFQMSCWINKTISILSEHSETLVKGTNLGLFWTSVTPTRLLSGKHAQMRRNSHAAPEFLSGSSNLSICNLSSLTVPLKAFSTTHST